MVSMQLPCEFFAFAFCKECALGTTHGVKFSPTKIARIRFQLGQSYECKPASSAHPNGTIKDGRAGRSENKCESDKKLVEELVCHTCHVSFESTLPDFECNGRRISSSAKSVNEILNKL